MAFKMKHQGFGAGTGDPVPSTSPKEKPKTDTNKNTSTTTRMRVGSVHASGSTALSFKKDTPNYTETPVTTQSGKLRTDSKHFSPKKKTTTKMPDWRKKKDAAVGKARG